MTLRSAMYGIIIWLVAFATGCNPFVESKYSNCVIAEDTRSFIGEKLKNSGNADSSRMLTTDCADKDRDIDAGDGNMSGRVRWVVCLQGPDCDEAGMY